MVCPISLELVHSVDEAMAVMPTRFLTGMPTSPVRGGHGAGSPCRTCPRRRTSGGRRSGAWDGLRLQHAGCNSTATTLQSFSRSPRVGVSWSNAPFRLSELEISRDGAVWDQTYEKAAHQQAEAYPGKLARRGTKELPSISIRTPRFSTRRLYSFDTLAQRLRELAFFFFSEQGLEAHA